MTFRGLVSLLLKSYIIFLPFEWVFIHWFLHVPTHVTAFRLSLDLFPIILLILCLALSQVKLTQLSLLLLGAYLGTLTTLLISNLIHGGRIASIPGHFGVIFRFVPLTIIISCLNPMRWNFDWLRTWSKKLLFFLMGLGLLEILLEEKLRRFLIPSQELFKVIFDRLPVSLTQNKYYQVSTVFVNPIEYAFLLVGLYIIYLSNDSLSKKKKLFVAAICLLVTFESGSMAAFFFLFLLSYFALVEKPLYKYFTYLSALIISSFVIYLNWNYVSWYLDISYQFNRLGILVNTFPSFLSSGIINVLFGLGSDSDKIYQIITSYPNVPLMITYDGNLAGFEDMYWVAMLISNGLISFSLLTLTFLELYKYSKKLERPNSLIVQRLLIMTLLLGFANQVLEVKPFSLLLWITFGIFLNEMRNQKLNFQDQQNG